MTISSSMNAGVTGLFTNSTRLAAIADNIANSSTYGYKRVEADFHSMVIGANNGGYVAGGVRATTQRLIDESGPLVTTSNSTDIAVRGRGLIPVASAYQVASTGTFDTMMLATTGSFRTDEDGYLVTESGLALLGWPADATGAIPLYPRDTSDGLEPVQINVNELTGEPTTTVSLGLNLPATKAYAGSTEDAEQLSIEYYDNLGISENLVVTFTPTGTVNEWQMEITDSASSGAVVGDYILTFDDSRTAGGTLASVADNTGNPGASYDSTTGTMVVTVAGGPIELDIGVLGLSGGLTQLSDIFAPTAIEKDGSPVGNMTSIEVDANGYVHAYYDSGVRRTLYQVPLADLPNVNGMFSLDRQTYLPSPASGAYFLWNAGEGPTGDVVSFAREESATDVASELTDMIRTQRAYSSNAKVFQTVDEMLQETTNIKR
ncbi:flagellar hook-basal body complex protein [Pseudooceanicola sp. CBS1P-1]|uniref:Flagellar hook protein FlgE n=1 Tax=Pseudooceanicola albus TaxID=2692189 RepID=A0A6L7G8R5_9RHOB|nr:MULTISPECIES: flagellar hook-basal body complex protein [Pseudooceanicola]MBT9385810.1 flagellar hook-basal body complex protein [Pseudooceanicola endophyticus]MXN20042.1 flagellar hook-basal body complex protein [Pseudooceanicola albus]